MTDVVEPTASTSASDGWEWPNVRLRLPNPTTYFGMMTNFIDSLAGLALRMGRARNGIFPGGWGDPVIVEMLSDASVLQEQSSPADIVWGRKEERRGYRVTRGHFSSPIAPLLPAVARVVTVERIEPAKGSTPTVILLPAWNDHDFSRRRTVAASLLDSGVGSLMIDIPFYGARRTTTDREPAIRTVSDFALMGYGAIREAHALAATLTSPHGFAGFSMGGNLAAIASATSGDAVATAGLAASHSPGPVYLDGVLSIGIAWEALGGRDVHPRLRKTLSSASALNYEAQPHHKSAVLVAADGDGFVPIAAVTELADHWGAELRRIRGGHATALWRQGPSLADAITTSFDRLAAASA